MLKLERLDHLVLTTPDLARTTHFYKNVLGMELQRFGEGRLALVYGQQKINLHLYKHEFEPKAKLPTPGSLDLCFLTDMPLEEAMAWVEEQGIEIIEGPVTRTGTLGPILSFYIRDPDGNLIEIANSIKN